MRLALTGNPNSGKTTMYNALTGRNEKVANWAGVTVEKKEHPVKKGYYAGDMQLIAVDLPGAYSMSPFTSEESITSSYVKKETNLVKSVNQIELFDTVVAFLAGMMIIPAVFVFSGAQGMSDGPTLMFRSLPKVFGAMGGVGVVVGVVFFLAVAFAALTSSVSIM